MSNLYFFLMMRPPPRSTRPDTLFRSTTLYRSLSFDIDLVYLPVADRDRSLQAVRDGLERIATRLERGGRMTVERRLPPDGKRLVVQSDGAIIKIEVSPVLRGTVFPPVRSEEHTSELQLLMRI